MTKCFMSGLEISKNKIALLNLIIYEVSHRNVSNRIIMESNDFFRKTFLALSSRIVCWMKIFFFKESTNKITYKRSKCSSLKEDFMNAFWTFDKIKVVCKTEFTLNCNRSSETCFIGYYWLEIKRKRKKRNRKNSTVVKSIKRP